MIPIGDKVWVKYYKEEAKTHTGLFIPDIAKDSETKAPKGLVLAVGPGRYDSSGNIIPMQIKAGDVILFNKYAGIPMDEDHCILREDEVLAIIDK